MVAHRRAALSCSRRSPRGRTSGLGAPREPRAYRCTGSAAGERGQRNALWFCLSAYCTRLSQALVGSVDPVCPGLTAPGALPLAQRLRLPPGPTTVVAPTPKPYKTGALPPAAQPHPTASSPLFSQIASRWFDILPWQPEEANLDLARAIPPPPRARHCTCPPARPSAILEEPPGFRRQDLRRDASEQPRWLISDASEHPRAEPTRLRDFV